MRALLYGIFFSLLFGLGTSHPKSSGGERKSGKVCAGEGVVLLEFKKLKSRGGKGSGFYYPYYQFLPMTGGRALWDFGRAGGEVAFLLRRRIYMDRNGNGKVDAPDGDPLNDRDLLEGSLRFRGKREAYKARIRLFGDGSYFRLDPESALAGRRGPFEMVFLDANMDGRFFQFGIDRVLVRKRRAPGADFRKSRGRGRLPVKISRPGFQPLSRVLRLGEDLFVIHPVQGGEA